VLVIAGDGLDSIAMTEFLEEALVSLKEGLKSRGIKQSAEFFVKFARMGVMFNIGELTGAESAIIFVGERPGLGKSSMSAYVAYRPNQSTSAADTTAMSNINPKGIHPRNAGSRLAGIIEKVLNAKASGVKLQLDEKELL
jgi:ethanolamine ammonia-lyase small subunit